MSDSEECFGYFVLFVLISSFVFGFYHIHMTTEIHKEEYCHKAIEQAHKTSNITYDLCQRPFFTIDEVELCEIENHMKKNCVSYDTKMEHGKVEVSKKIY